MTRWPVVVGVDATREIMEFFSDFGRGGWGRYGERERDHEVLSRL